MPIDLAEHDIASEDHQLGGCFAFVRDRQTVALFVQTQAADQPSLVEMPAVRYARMKAVAEQIVQDRKSVV